MRAAMIALGLLTLSACNEPTDGVDESQATEMEQLAPVATPEEMQAADQPNANVEQAPDALDANIQAEKSANLESE
ncbi:hypothetical protein SAMN06297468_0304 [Altererythrobacter xiamenensis]|uniref:Uncharacterized protein n=1 Tax=Altererythrobacter xiamenensis TaxID=1316679 RepID=A0A1Y6EAG2_9SPHN|nr:hypothetical protein [Altererythrobacter xiamenensis]SMQ59575.1 hypothetical protein SAMN06297468_0304 [Altererythrobacter xiamenensis]